MLPKTIKSLILDMDGVLWTENSPIGDLEAIFATLSKRSLKVCLATNNATRTPEQYLDRLFKFGVTGIDAWQIVTSGHALANELGKRFSVGPHGTSDDLKGGEVYVIGEAGLHQAVAEAGFSVVDEENWNGPERIVAVAVGMDRGISFPKLRRATLLIRSGVPFYATNPDRTFPTPDGLIPGAGALTAALVAASDVEPVVVGKPARFMIDLARQRLCTSPAETLVVGDRLETDIAGGQAAGCPVALVLSGVTSRQAGEAWKPKVDLIAADLTTLLA